MDWFEDWFNTPYYHLLYENHDFSEAQAFITKITHYLQLKKQACVIDLACGKGRHSLFLNQLGYDVLGLDLSKQNIEYDKKFENENLHFRVHDMRDPIAGNPVDAVFNLFTSFGYFESETDDVKVFQSVSDILKPNAVFVMDYLNETFVRKNLVEHTVIYRDEIQFNINKHIENQYVIKNINFTDKGKEFNFYEKVKLISPEKLNEYAKKVSLTREKMWGDYELSEFDSQNSPRCIILFRKS